jgi:hypothetical protein
MDTSLPRHSAISRFFSRSSNAFITAAATIIAALISVYGVQKHEQTVADDRVAQVQQQLDATRKELRNANAKLAAVTTDTTTTEPVPAPEPTQDIYSKTPIATKTQQGFEIKLFGCPREGGAVRCYFSVTNRRAERRLQIAGYPGDQRYSRAFDDQGQLHTTEVPEILGISDTEVTLPENVTLRASLTFKSVPNAVRGFAVLKFVFHYAYNTYEADFPDVVVR